MPTKIPHWYFSFDIFKNKHSIFYSFILQQKLWHYHQIIKDGNFSHFYFSFSVLDVLYVPVLLILCLYCKLQILVPVCHLSVLLISAMVSGFQPQLEMFSLPRVCWETHPYFLVEPTWLHFSVYIEASDPVEIYSCVLCARWINAFLLSLWLSSCALALPSSCWLGCGCADTSFTHAFIQKSIDWMPAGALAVPQALRRRTPRLLLAFCPFVS